MAFKKQSLDDFISKSVKVHGNKYDYSKTVYTGCRDKLCIICPEHGEFWQKAGSHLSGAGCPICGNKYKSHSKIYDTSKWVERAKEIHGEKYNYSKVEYISPYEKVCIICPEHGEFWQKATYHLSGNGCPECGKEMVKKINSANAEDFVTKASKIYYGKYDYSKVEYVNNKTEVIVVCPKHGNFSVRPDNHLTGRNGCPMCSNNHSNWEIEILNFIRSIGVDCVSGERNIIDGKEIDIFLPGYGIGFECNGLKWHSEEFKDKKYHLNKMISCNERGVALYQIFEDEWRDKKNIVIGRIKSILHKNDSTIYARNCKIMGISEKRYKDFVSENHLQGYVPSDYAYGLTYNGKLVSVMSFGYARKNLGRVKKQREYELLRFCTAPGVTVVGGASRLLSMFCNRKKPKSIISYCDLRWSSGNMYEKLGFELDHISEPNYFYIVGDKRKNRFNFRKDILVKEGYDPGKTEHEIMLERKIYRIYDCGCKVYKMNI